MDSSVRLIDACRVCGRNDWLDVLDFGDTTLANGFIDPPAAGEPEPKYPLEVVVCRHCWLMTLRHVVDPEVLFRDYVYVTSDSDLITEHMRHIVEAAGAQASLAAGDLVVELGSNIGTQLGMFAEQGYRVVGVDPARNLAEIANARGIETLPTFFGEGSAAAVQERHGLAKLVVGRQCFAHINDVHDVLRGVTGVLAEDGVVVIEVPYLLNLLDENQFDTIFHEHLSYYSFGTLRTLFAAHGLRMVNVERAPVHGGSIVVFGARETSAHTPAPAVAELLVLEESRSLYTERAYREFAARTTRTIGAIGEFVRGLAAAGKRVAGYGAPSKGCALLEFCGITAEHLEYVTDTTVAKQGRLTPHTHVPVWSPEQAATQPPDYFLLLAWNYAEEIIAKEHRFLENGGRIIVPIPEPRVVSGPVAEKAA